MANKYEDMPKNIVVLVFMIAIIVSVMGTWMVLDKISSVETATSNAMISHPKSVALDIEYDTPENKTGAVK